VSKQLGVQHRAFCCEAQAWHSSMDDPLGMKSFNVSCLVPIICYHILMTLMKY